MNTQLRERVNRNTVNLPPNAHVDSKEIYSEKQARQKSAIWACRTRPPEAGLQGSPFRLTEEMWHGEHPWCSTEEKKTGNAAGMTRAFGTVSPLRGHCELFSAKPILPPGLARPVPVLLRLYSTEATEMKSLEVDANNFSQPGRCVSHMNTATCIEN
ncbi:hypothetical protein NQZ68_001450 [Dissostichus eleginoides]|nr:hypothetical protein NQZ68_001450 [Dissostichus eleginoides]